jgi:excisionase family DNA binding protein
MDPLVFSITEAYARSGIGRTAMYELINAGQLRARKRGRRTLILAEDLRRYLESLPPIKAKSEVGRPHLEVGLVHTIA